MIIAERFENLFTSKRIKTHEWAITAEVFLLQPLIDIYFCIATTRCHKQLVASLWQW